jgi:hypothetical protein
VWGYLQRSQAKAQLTEAGWGGKEAVRWCRAGSSVTWIPAWAAIRCYHAFQSISERDICCWARQVQIRGWSRLAETTVPTVVVLFTSGPSSWPSQRRAKHTTSEPERARKREVGMVSDLMEDCQHARKFGGANALVPLEPEQRPQTRGCAQRPQKRMQPPGVLI